MSFPIDVNVLNVPSSNVTARPDLYRRLRSDAAVDQARLFLRDVTDPHGAVESM